MRVNPFFSPDAYETDSQGTIQSVSVLPIKAFTLFDPTWAGNKTRERIFIAQLAVSILSGI